MRLTSLSTLALGILLMLPAAAQADELIQPASEDTWTLQGDSDPVSSSGVHRGTGDDELWSLASSTAQERGFLKFNVTGVSGTIESAVVRLTVSNKSYSNTTNGPAIAPVPCDWTEADLVHSTAPTPGVATDNKGALSNGQVVSYNVATVENGFQCFALVADSSNDTGFWSSEAPTQATRPVLDVVYTPQPSPPPTATSHSASPNPALTTDTIQFAIQGSTCPGAPCTYNWTASLVTLGTPQTITWSSATPSSSRSLPAGRWNVRPTITDSFGQTADRIPPDPLTVDVTAPPSPQCSDGVNNDPSEDSNIDFPADLGCTSAADNSESPNPPTGGGLIPPEAIPQSAGMNEYNGSGSFTTSQCPHAVPYMTEAGTTFARFQRNPGEPQAAGGFRCEDQSSTYIGKGVYWFEWRSRYPNGYEPSCASWCTMRQWHENTSDGGGPVYLAMFMQNGRPQIDGQFVSAGSQSLDVDVRQWHTYTARINFASNSTGWAELWIDGVFSGRTTTNITATPSNSYDKRGTYGGDSNTTRTADYDYTRAWRMP